MGQDTGLKDADTLLTTTFGKLETEAALANAGLADDTDNTTITLDCIFEFKDEGRKLACAAGETA